MALDRTFPSFWMAGFECASQIHRNGRGRLDLTAELQHDRHCTSDYAMLAQFGFRTARDGIRWHLIERQPGQYDFSSVEPLRQAAEQHGILVIWDIYHYGSPEDVHPLQPDFADRFARFARAFAQYMKDHSGAVPFYAPINEASYVSWAAGHEGIFAPFARGQGNEVKQNLVRAEIAGIEAIRDVEPRARIVHTDPLIHAVAPPHRPDLLQAAHDRNESQFQALDMLVGRLAPELGGHPRYLDILGFNFYPENQEDMLRVTLARSDPGWVDLSDLLAEAYERYRRPFFLSETSANGPMRGPWLEYVTAEAIRLLERGLPFLGVCLYPITSAPHWDTGLYQAFGLWDLEPQPDGHLARVLNEPVAAALRAAQERLRLHEEKWLRELPHAQPNPG